MNKEKLLEILEDVRPDVDFENEDQLVDGNILDSFDIITIVGEIKNAFGINITVTDFVPENFNSVEKIIECIGLENPKIVSALFDRKNIFYDVKRSDKKLNELIAYISKHKNELGIRVTFSPIITVDNELPPNIVVLEEASIKSDVQFVALKYRVDNPVH